MSPTRRLTPDVLALKSRTTISKSLTLFIKTRLSFSKSRTLLFKARNSFFMSCFMSRTSCNCFNETSSNKRRIAESVTSSSIGCSCPDGPSTGPSASTACRPPLSWMWCSVALPLMVCFATPPLSSSSSSTTTAAAVSNACSSSSLGWFFSSSFCSSTSSSSSSTAASAASRGDCRGGGGGGGSASKKAEAAASSSGAACSSAATPAVVGPPGLSVLAGGASGSAPCSAAVASSASGGGPSQQKSQQAANKAARKPAAVRLEMYDNEQQAPQGLPVGLVGGDQNAIALAGDVGGGINDYSMVAAGNRGLPGSQGGCLPVQRHASMPPGGAGMLMPRSKGQGGMDNSRAAAGLPGRHPMMHGGMPGAVDHYGGLNPVDLPPGPCGLPDRGAQMWGGPQQVGPPGHMPPPGLWGGDYSQEPLPVGPASRGWGQQQPNYLGHYGGKGSGPGHGQLGKGPGNMMGGWHDVQGAQGGAPGLAPGGPMQPNMDQLQYMPMSF
mmetsp:Transcript_145531/g.466428  ORF Transcript_145531/g.466428 Transcript_145531/m.466428 type:complete len:496 (+) Transcript_145531:1095-2582(+)